MRNRNFHSANKIGTFISNYLKHNHGLSSQKIMLKPKVLHGKSEPITSTEPGVKGLLWKPRDGRTTIKRIFSILFFFFLEVAFHSLQSYVTLEDEGQR